MKNVLILVLTFVLTIFVSNANAQVEFGKTQQIEKLLWEEARLREQVESNLAPIKSMEELKSHLASVENIRSPLKYLSPHARLRFVKSLSFGRGGLSSFDYTDLVAELTASQAYEVLRLFGMQHTIRNIPGLRVETSVDRAIMHIGMRPAFCNTIVPVLQSMTACDDDHWHNMKCGSPGTCRGEVGSICTSNC